MPRTSWSETSATSAFEKISRMTCSSATCCAAVRRVVSASDVNNRSCSRAPTLPPGTLSSFFSEVAGHLLPDWLAQPRTSTLGEEPMVPQHGFFWGGAHLSSPSYVYLLPSFPSSVSLPLPPFLSLPPSPPLPLRAMHNNKATFVVIMQLLIGLLPVALPIVPGLPPVPLLP